MSSSDVYRAKERFCYLAECYIVGCSDDGLPVTRETLTAAHSAWKALEARETEEGCG